MTGNGVEEICLDVACLCMFTFVYCHQAENETMSQPVVKSHFMS